MKFLCNFFEESPGVSSSSRLIFILGTFYNMVLTAYLAHTGKNFTKYDDENSK